MFSIWLCSFQSTFFGHHASRAGFRRGFFKSFAPSGSLSLTLRSQVFALAIPENDTGSRRRTVNLVPLTGTFASRLLFVFEHLLCSQQTLYSLSLSFVCIDLVSSSAFLLRLLPRKEVIQPHLPIRLPCYDFTPVIGLTFDGSLLIG